MIDLEENKFVSVFFSFTSLQPGERCLIDHTLVTKWRQKVIWYQIHCLSLGSVIH